MNKRVNVSLPEGTLRLLDQVAAKRERSRLISEAVQFYVKEMGRAKLRQKLREGAIRRGERDLALAQEWFPLEDEPWHGRRK